MKKIIFLMIAAVMVVPLFGQAGKKTLAVDEVKVSESLRATLSRDDRNAMMKRVAESLDRHLMTSITTSRKFTIVGRRDIQSILDEQELAGETGIIGKKGAKFNAITGAQYKLVVFLDSFQEETNVAEFNGTSRMKRRFQVSAQANIYDSSTSEVLDSANIQTEKVDIIDIGTGSSNRVGGRMDEMIPLITRELSDKITTRLLAVLFPAKVIDIDDTTVTINRGEGFVKVGDTLKVHTPGRTITDADTGEVIKIKGKLAGTIKVTSVEPTYSQGEIISGKGIGIGSQVSL